MASDILVLITFFLLGEQIEGKSECVPCSEVPLH